MIKNLTKQNRAKVDKYRTETAKVKTAWKCICTFKIGWDLVLFMVYFSYTVHSIVC